MRLLSVSLARNPVEMEKAQNNRKENPGSHVLHNRASCAAETPMALLKSCGRFSGQCQSLTVILTGLLFTCGGWVLNTSAALPADRTERFVAIGDLHGGLNELRKGNAARWLDG